MALIKKRQEVNFTQVSNEVLRNDQMSLKLKGLFAYLWSKPENWDFSSERVAQENKDEVKSIQRALKELESFGYLIRTKLPDGKMIYELDFEPEVQKAPLGTKAKSAKRQTDKTHHIYKTDINCNINNNIVEPKLVLKDELTDVYTTTPADEARSFFTSEVKQIEVITFLVEKNLFSPSFATTELKKFVSYWTEPNKSGKKQRWELEKTFDVKRRLSTWLNNSRKFSSKKEKTVTSFVN